MSPNFASGRPNILHEHVCQYGHSPAMLLKSYAKPTKKSDEAAANILGIITAGLADGL